MLTSTLGPRRNNLINISAKFKLEAPFKISNVRFEGVLYQYLLGLDGVHTTAGQFDCSDPSRNTGNGRDTGYGTDSAATLEVDDVGHRLLSDNRDGADARVAQSQLHHLPR